MAFLHGLSDQPAIYAHVKNALRFPFLEMGNEMSPAGKFIKKQRRIIAVDFRIPFSRIYPEGLVTYCNFACIHQRTPVGWEDGNEDRDRINPELRRYLQSLVWDTVARHPMAGLLSKQSLLKN